MPVQALQKPAGVTPGGESPFRARTLTGAGPEHGRAPDLLLLDGQQRLASLFQALSLDMPVETADARGRAVERWSYVDIAKAVQAPADRDEAIVSVPEHKALRTDFARTVVLDLRTVDDECRAGRSPCTSSSTASG